ncbi:MAG: Mutator MutT protein [Candidatus Jorgensenbacteria bacterium GW2011_GWA1_48_11]|uniref:8-oxo-dGTP diphosphatase n=1 Tax=Candidatus Jorgensenbacteria bacterium GW2011_GWA1_48_11 TaxID=1618660 RepID=A0A0G1UAB2_9BACT|nr:MAG: Mutator MutT protein [Candidatus Jorgensenbacteria bacterium GW2011_GWA1_48_11]KKW11805.1 MAG: Mutator MutT protein [Candidatus Jorgensenbacteria bacterium GW2011_GWB1_49_9]
MKITNVTAAIIHRDGKIIIAQRDLAGYFGGFWEFPGGKSEVGESLQDCLIREIEEELGVKVNIEKEFLKTEHDYSIIGMVHLHSFLCGILSGEPKTLVHSAIKWVAIDDLEKFNFPPADMPIIKKLIAEKPI